MTISAAGDGSVVFETETLREEERTPVALLSRSTKRSTDQIRACAWCNRVDVGSGSNDWVEVEDATERFRLFEFGQVPELTHGMTSTLANMEANAEPSAAPDRT